LFVAANGRGSGSADLPNITTCTMIGDDAEVSNGRAELPPYSITLHQGLSGRIAETEQFPVLLWMQISQSVITSSGRRRRSCSSNKVTN
jgi:hypothetical protein